MNWPKEERGNYINYQSSERIQTNRNQQHSVQIVGGSIFRIVERDKIEIPNREIEVK